MHCHGPSHNINYHDICADNQELRQCLPLKRYLYTSFLFFFGMSMVSGVGVFPRRLKANSTPGEQALTCSTAAHPSRPPHEHGGMHAAQSWATL